MTAGVALAVACMTRTGWRVWLVALSRFSWMLLIAAGINLIFSKGGAFIHVWGYALPVTGEGVVVAATFTAQLAEAIVFSMALTFTTTPRELTRGLERLARPLSRLSFPVEEFSIVVLLALRFVPLLQHEVRTIVAAQKSRGVEFGKGNIQARGRTLIAVLVPALTGALRRADLLAVAMTERGFRPGEKRSEYRPLQFYRRDYLAAFFAFLLPTYRLLSG